MKEEYRTIYTRSFLDWAFNEDEQQNYMLVVEGIKDILQVGDQIILKVFGRPSNDMPAKIINVGDGYIIVHTEEDLDITEEYDIYKNF